VVAVWRAFEALEVKGVLFEEFGAAGLAAERQGFVVLQAIGDLGLNRCWKYQE
jgi:hypothetical protein